MSGPEPRLTRAERRRQTEARILAAAREMFSVVGYDRTTIRAVAAAAKVDPALVMQYFGNKDELFRQALGTSADDEVTDDAAWVTDLLIAVIGAKLTDEIPQDSLPLLRSMLTHPEATERLNESQRQQLARISAAIPTEDAELRAALVVAMLMGVAVERHLIGLAPLRDASPEQITDLLRPCFDALIKVEAEEGAPDRRRKG